MQEDEVNELMNIHDGKCIPADSAYMRLQLSKFAAIMHRNTFNLDDLMKTDAMFNACRALYEIAGLYSMGASEINKGLVHNVAAEALNAEVALEEILTSQDE